MKLLAVTKPRLYEHYHVEWAYSNGVVGLCMEIDELNRTVILRKPTGDNFKHPVKWSDLRHTRRNEINPH